MDFDLEFSQEINEYLLEAKAEGKKVIGIVGHDTIPEEIIHAAGALPLRLIFAGTEDLTNEGGNYISLTTCVFTRSVIGMFARREEEARWRFLNNVDAIVVSNFCNGDNFAGDMVSHYFKVPQFRIYIPYKRTKPAVAQYLAEITRFAEEIGDFCGRPVTDAQLWDSLVEYNRLREGLAQLGRRNLRGSEKQEHFNRALVFGPRYLPTLDQILGEAGSDKESPRGKKVLLAGAAPFIGDSLVELVEEYGGAVVENLTWTALNYTKQLADLTQRGESTALEEVARIFERNETSEHYVPHSYTRIAEEIAQACNESGINGVIYHILKFCEFTGTLQDKIRELLLEKGLKTLLLERDYSASVGQLATRIEAFLEIL